MKTVYLALILDTDDDPTVVMNNWLASISQEVRDQLPALHVMISDELLTSEDVRDMYDAALDVAVKDQQGVQ